MNGNKTIRWLGVLLLAQLLIAIWLAQDKTALSPTQQEHTLLSFAPAEINRLIIEDGEKNETELIKRDDKWQLPQAQDFPADGKKVEALLSKLSQLKAGSATATTAQAIKRFKLSEDDFERRISLHADDKPLGSIILGSSPGVRHIHARNAAEEAIYTVKFASHEVPVKISDWINKQITELAEAEIDTIAINQFTISTTDAQGEAAGGKDDKAEPQWLLSGLDDGSVAQPEAVTKLVRAIAGLNISEVAPSEEQATASQSGESGTASDIQVLDWTVALKNGENIEYHLSQSADGLNYYLTTSAIKQRMRVASFIAKPLVEAAQPKALTAPANAAADGGETGNSDTAASNPPASSEPATPAD